MIFEDRHEAGQKLAEALARYTGRPNVIVLALPRGGVPVAYPVAEALRAPLDILLVRKLGLPGHEELAMGAIATGGVQLLNPDVARHYGVTREQIQATVRREQAELERRERLYRGNRDYPDLRGKTVILVDDGLATGASMQAAVLAVRQKQPAEIVIAVPVASQETCDMLAEQVTEVICLHTPEPFYAVGLWYREFGQTTDDEVRELLNRARETLIAPRD
ncbi:MAG: phosphoribosyltransferase [Chloroflexota bacterium]|nr:MAG: phosphoribosyl transferase [Chloroflexota bacterium]